MLPWRAPQHPREEHVQQVQQAPSRRLTTVWCNKHRYSTSALMCVCYKVWDIHHLPSFCFPKLSFHWWALVHITQWKLSDKILVALHQSQLEAAELLTATRKASKPSVWPSDQLVPTTGSKKQTVMGTIPKSKFIPKYKCLKSCTSPYFEVFKKVLYMYTYIYVQVRNSSCH